MTSRLKESNKIFRLSFNWQIFTMIISMYFRPCFIELNSAIFITIKQPVATGSSWPLSVIRPFQKPISIPDIQSWNIINEITVSSRPIAGGQIFILNHDNFPKKIYQLISSLWL